MNSVAITEVGKVRTANQDYVFCSDTPVGKIPNLYIVADGMGGHRAGDLASKYTVEILVNQIENSEFENPIGIIQNAIEEANFSLIKKAHESQEYEGMGTTLVVATVWDNTLYVANIGDSRLYIVNDEIKQITRDHSLVEEMIHLGELDKDSARVHANKNIITKAVGVDPDLEADYFEVEILDGDTVLLCSDGLTNMLEDEVIKEIVHKGKKLTATARELVDTANRNGGEDNISVVLVVQNLNLRKDG